MRSHRDEMQPKWIWLLGGLLAVVLVASITWAQRPRAFAPEQPIAFSHRQHVTDYGIDCQYCHSAARRSPFAGVPSVDRCLGCHFLIASDRPEVAKIHEYQERGEPIPWIKVYTLPQFVRFTHEPHVRAGVACAACHGPVETMDRIERVRDFQMGWCLDCHRTREASIDCLACHY